MHKVTIGGNEVAVSWNQGTARRAAYRQSKGGASFRFHELSNKNKAFAALLDALWLLLPAGEFEKYESPEHLSEAIDHENELEQIAETLTSIALEMIADAEKKTSLTSTHLP